MRRRASRKQATASAARALSENECPRLFRLGIVGPEPDGLREMQDGLGGAAGRREREAEVEMRDRVAGFQANRLLEARETFGDATGIREGDAEIIVRLGIIRAEVQRQAAEKPAS